MISWNMARGDVTWEENEEKKDLLSPLASLAHTALRASVGPAGLKTKTIKTNGTLEVDQLL